MERTPVDAGFSTGRPLGRGAHGRVVAATAPSGEPVALKWMPAATAHEAARARAEVETLAALRHPSVVGMLDHGRQGDEVWLAMERGTADLDERPPTTVAELHMVCTHVLRALIHAHARGILHRDLKPANLVWTPQGHVCVTDFGVAWRSESCPTDLHAGTPGFMAPEQQSTDLWDYAGWTDLYALGRLVSHLWPYPTEPWRAWAAWLTATSPAHRPRNAARALLAMPAPHDAPLDTVPATVPATVRASGGDVRSTGPVATWPDHRLPLHPPETPRRTDRVPASAVGLTQPPFSGRDAFLAEIWSLLTGPRDHARCLRIGCARGMGATSHLDRLADHLHAAGATLWRAHPGEDAVDMLRRVVRAWASPDAGSRWATRRDASELGPELCEALEGEQPVTVALLARALSLEPGPRILLAERPSADLAAQLDRLGTAEVDVRIVWFDAHTEPILTVDPLTPMELEAVLAAWTDARTSEHLDLFERYGAHPGWLFSNLARPHEPPPVTEDPALAALVWWPDTLGMEAFLHFCESRGIHVPLQDWFERGWVHRQRGTLLDAQLLGALRGELPQSLRPHLDALFDVQTDPVERAALALAAGQGDQAVGLYIDAAEVLVRAGRHHRVLALADRIGGMLASDDPRQGRLDALRLASLHSMEGRREELSALADRVLEDRDAPGWEEAVYARTSLALLNGHARQTVEWLDSLQPLSPYLNGALSSALFDAGDYERIESLWSHTLKLLPSTRAEAAFMTGDTELAESIAHQFIAEPDTLPSQRMRLFNLLGAILVHRNQLDEAEVTFRRAADLGRGMVESLQPLTNAIAVAAMRGRREQARREAELLLPRLERHGWRQNIGWILLVLWATCDDPGLAESHGARAREIFAHPVDTNQAVLAGMAATHLTRAGRHELAERASTWARSAS